MSIVWLRRDLRQADNAAIAQACEQSRAVVLAFVINPPLLAEDRMGAPLVSVFFDALANLRADLQKRGSDLALLQGDFTNEILALARRIDASAIFFNEDYEPSAVRRDALAREAFAAAGLQVHSALDHVYFGADDVTRDGSEPYRMFTPYKRRWFDRRAIAPRRPFPSERMLEGRLLSREALGETLPVPRCEDFGFAQNARYPKASEARAVELLESFLSRRGPASRYRKLRDFPAVAGTSFLSPQLRAGTIGIRACVEAAFARCAGVDPEARANIETWIGELVWRDFYQAILKRFPHVVAQPFLASGKRIAWLDSANDFRAWCDGLTGYPIVDAAMRQLNETGWMHNRLRMVTASFLSKHLLIDWRLGERYFERHLADADPAQNNGGWQWAASTGTDAVPYFRVFNPITQS
jgi:deoxyribodipyrimidine photo-lyase